VTRVLTKDAKKVLDRLDQSLQRRIFTRLAELAEHPRSAAAEKLQGSDFFRTRIGDHRTIYTVEEDRLLVLVLPLAHRREAYRRLVRRRAGRS
jgi:mRNA interferase RelE/StbE